MIWIIPPWITATIDPMRSPRRFLSRMLGLWVLFALLVQFILPHGMMAVRDHDAGLMVVLCTANGPEEIWLPSSSPQVSDNDVLEPKDSEHGSEGDGDDPHAAASCLRITLASAVVAGDWHPALRLASYEKLRRPVLCDWLCHRRVATGRFARAPPSVVS